jgi:predicted ATP-dependent serine protease
MFPMFTLKQLREMPPLAWLVEGTILEESVVILYGPSGVGKTFVALDLALSITEGRPWLGMSTKQGSVVYVQAESPRGMVPRADAWAAHHSVTLGEKFHVVPDAVQLMDSVSVSAFIKTVEPVDPVVIFIDTLSRAFVGGEENSAKDVGTLLNGARRISQETGATVILIHHTGKDLDGGERGSSAFRGNVDTTLSLKKSGNDVLLKIVKQREGEDGGVKVLRLAKVEGSLVVTSASDAPSSKVGGSLAPDVAAALELLCGFPNGLRVKDWRAALVTKLGRDVPDGTCGTGATLSGTRDSWSPQRPECGRPPTRGAHTLLCRLRRTS